MVWRGIGECCFGTSPIQDADAIVTDMVASGQITEQQRHAVQFARWLTDAEHDAELRRQGNG